MRRRYYSELCVSNPKPKTIHEFLNTTRNICSCLLSIVNPRLTLTLLRTIPILRHLRSRVARAKLLYQATVTVVLVVDLLENLMPNHKSAEKRMRQNERRKKINRGNRSRVRSAIRGLRSALGTGDTKQVQELLPTTISTIDKAVQNGALHRNAAARYKSRLTARANATAAK